MTTYIKHITTICFCIAAVGCTTDEALLARIDEAERISDSLPSEAIAIMRSIDRDDIYGEADNARYALVYSEALYHNGTPVDCDSLTQPMMMYYLDDDNHDERVRALYQHALVAHAAGRNGEAMYALIEAERSFDKCHNLRCKGLIHRTKGEIYNEECMFNEALTSYQHSFDFFEEANLPSHSAYSKYLIGITLDKMREYDDAEENLRDVYNRATSLQDNQLLEYSAMALCNVYTQIGKYHECHRLLPILQTSCDSLIKYNYHCNNAVLNAYDYDFDEAYRSLDSAYVINPANDRLSKYRISKYLVTRYKGDIEDAHNQYLDIIARQDTLMLSVFNKPLLDAQLTIYRNELTQQEQIFKTRRLKTIIIVMMLSFIVFALTIYIIYRRYKHRKQVEQYIEQISNLRLTINNVNAANTTALHVEKLYQKQLADLNLLCNTYYEHNNSSRQTTKVFEQVKANISAISNDQQRIAELESIVNYANNNVMVRLKDCCLSLTEREYKIILYTYAGFTPLAVCLFVDTDSLNLPKIKYKIRNKIKLSEIEDKSDIIAKLSS